MLQASDRTDGFETIQHGVLRSGGRDRPQFGHGLTAIRDHERSTLTNALEVRAEPGLQFAGADGGMPGHVVMMTTSGALVNPRKSPAGPRSNRSRCRRSTTGVVTAYSTVLRRVTIGRMDRTLTIRLDREKDEALTRRARVLGKTRSELVRELIDKAVTDHPLGRRLGHLKGSVELPRPRSGWRRELKERNWR